MALVPVLNSAFYALNSSYYARWYYMPIPVSYTHLDVYKRQVHGHALAQAAHVEIAAGKLRQRAAAAVQRCYIAVLTALLHGLVQIFFDAREIGEIVFDERVGFLDADADILSLIHI